MVSAVNCTDDPFEVPNDDKGMYDWTGDIGPGIPVNKSYGDIVRYWCEKEGWGYPSNGLSEMYAVCQANKMWNLTEVDKCMCKFFDLSITLCCLFIVNMANSDKLEMTPIPYNFYSHTVFICMCHDSVTKS